MISIRKSVSMAILLKDISKISKFIYINNGQIIHPQSSMKENISTIRYLLKIYLVLRGFKAILLMMRFQGFFVVFRNLIPVNNAEKFLDIVWATVLVVQIICMFPYV